MPHRFVGAGRTGRALVLLAALVLVTAAVPPAAGTQTDPVAFETSGDRLLVTVERDAFDGDPAITVIVAGAERGPFEPAGRNSETYSFAIPFESLAVEGEPMADVLVAAWTGDRLLGRDVLALQAFAFGDPAGARFADDGTLRLPVERAVGFGGSVALAVGDGGTATADLAADGTALALDRQSLAAHADALRNDRVAFAVRPAAAATGGDGSLAVDVRALAARETAAIRAADGAGIVVETPLAFEGTTYRVEVVTGDGERTVATVTAGADGRLAVRDDALAGADAVRVAVDRQGAVVVETGDLRVEDPAGSTAGEDRAGDEDESDAADDGPDSGDRADSPRDGDGLVPVQFEDDRYVAAAVVLAVIVGLLGAVGAVLYRARRRTRRGGGGGGRGGGGSRSDDGGGAAGGGGDVAGGGGPAGGGVAGGGDDGGAGGGGGSGGDDADESDRPRARVASVPQVTVRLVDGDTGAPLTAEGEVLAESASDGSASRQRVPLSDGRATLQLEPGRWRLTARGDGVSVAEDVVVSSSTTFSLRVPPDEVGVEVRDAGSDEPVPDASVACRPADGEPLTARTDGSGRAVFESLPDGPLAVTVDHDRYEEASREFESGGHGTVALRPLTGTVRSTVTVGGRPTAGVPVEVVARDAYVKRHRQERHGAETDGRGRVEVADLLVGTYEVRAAFPEGRRRFSRPSRMVEVADGAVVRANLDVEFSYSLTPAQLNRMAAVRERVEALSSPTARAESLATATERDVVVPRYYGSVVSSLLDVVGRLPAEGHRFAGTDAPPDRLVAALLDAAEAATDAVETAMAAPENEALFAACADLPDREVAWEGALDVATLFDLLATGDGAGGRRLRERLDGVSERIADERASLATLSPVEDALDEASSLVGAARRTDDPVAAAATTFAADALLDAIEGVLDDEALRERLARSPGEAE